MRKLIYATFVATVFFTSSGYSQPLTVGSQGSKAVLFNFSGLSNLALTGYQGGIGGKYYISNDLALRALLLFGINNATTNTAPQSTDDKLSFGIGGGLEYHLALNSNVSPYVGGAITFTDNSESFEGPVTPKSTTTSVAVAIGAIGGVEYYFNQNISLAAEYQFGLTSTTTTSTGQPDRSGFALGFQTAGLTMGVYF